MYRTVLALIPSAFALALPTPALANWETLVHVPQNTPDRCSSDQNSGVVLLKASENRPLRMAAGSKIMVEVFGHGIDLPRTFSMEGATVTWQGSTGGAENVTRRCGAIGSVKLFVSLPNPQAGTPLVGERATALVIGDVRIPVTVILPTSYDRFAWHRFSGRTDGVALSPRTTNTPSGTTTVSSSPSIAPPQITVQSGPTCQETQTCGGGGTTGFVVNGPRGSTGIAPRDDFKDKTLDLCIRGRGGDVRIAGTRLEIMLPDERGGDVRDCLTRPSFADADQRYVRADVVGVPLNTTEHIPQIRASASGGSEATASTLPEDNGTASIQFNRDFMRTMIGVRNFRLLATNFAGQTKALDVRVQSVVPFGVENISTPTQLASTGGIRVPRIGGGGSASPAPAAPGALSFSLNLAPSDAASRPLVWQVLNPTGGTGGFAGLCFAQTEGTLAPAAGVDRVSVTLTRTANTACPGKTFVLVAAPNGRLDHQLYRKRLEFTLK